MDQAPGQVELAHRRPGPVDDRSRQDTSNLELLTEPEQDRVHPGGIHVGQLGQVADAHHHRGLGIAAANFDITAERGREAKADRLEDRVDAKGHALSAEEFDRLIEAFERAGLVGDRDDLDTPLRCTLAVARIHAQDELGAGRAGRGDLRRVEAVDRNPHAAVTERRDGLADPRPRRARLAAEVDQVGPLGAEPLGLPDQFVPLEPGRMVDLGQNLDVMAPIAGRPPGV